MRAEHFSVFLPLATAMSEKSMKMIWKLERDSCHTEFHPLVINIYNGSVSGSSIAMAFNCYVPKVVQMSRCEPKWRSRDRLSRIKMRRTCCVLIACTVYWRAASAQDACACSVVIRASNNVSVSLQIIRNVPFTSLRRIAEPCSESTLSKLNCSRTWSNQNLDSDVKAGLKLL